MCLILGVDPGLTGAISLLCSRRGLLECADLPTCTNGTITGSMKRWLDVAALLATLQQWSLAHDFAEDSVMAAIERPIPMPSLPSQTIASQFDTFGAIRAVLSMTVGDADMHVLTPHEWKKTYGLNADKNAARACCLRLYPSAPVTLVKHHNRADSVLVAHHILRKFH